MFSIVGQTSYPAPNSHHELRQKSDVSGCSTRQSTVLVVPQYLSISISKIAHFIFINSMMGRLFLIILDLLVTVILLFIAQLILSSVLRNVFRELIGGYVQH